MSDFYSQFFRDMVANASRAPSEKFFGVRIDGKIECVKKMISGLYKYQLARNKAIYLLCTLFFLLLPCVISTFASAEVAVPSFRNFRDCDVCSEMIVLPAGKYMMGATEEEFRGEDNYRFMYQDEIPRHLVNVSSFGIAKFDVTRGQFSVFAKETRFEGKGCRIFDGGKWFFDKTADWENPGFRQSEQDPVVCVSWNDAQKFIAWINSRISNESTHRYRLPAETEWEYAARAGTDSAMYWGDDRSKQCKYENTRDLSKERANPIGPYVNCDSGYVRTSPVGSFQPNPWGLFDMLGDVYQWVSDCSGLGYTTPYRETPESIAISCSARRTRGGSWASIPFAVRAADRAGNKIDTRNSSIGFRMATTLSN